MAANRQQGSYLGIFTVAFTAIPVGFIGLVYDRPVLGAVITLGALLLLGYSLYGLRRIKAMEFTK